MSVEHNQVTPHLGPESKRETILFDVFILVFSVSDEIDVGKTCQLKKADCIIFVLLEKMDPIQDELKQQTDLY